jgi:hypothetical protein
MKLFAAVKAAAVAGVMCVFRGVSRAISYVTQRSIKADVERAHELRQEYEANKRRSEQTTRELTRQDRRRQCMADTEWIQLHRDEEENRRRYEQERERLLCLIAQDQQRLRSNRLLWQPQRVEFYDRF